jgi:hypothetical protein
MTSLPHFERRATEIASGTHVNPEIAMFARYQRLEQQGDFVQLPPPPPKPKIGDTYAGAPAPRRMLNTIGDLPRGDTTAPTDPTFDANLSAFVSSWSRCLASALSCCSEY